MKFSQIIVFAFLVLLIDGCNEAQEYSQPNTTNKNNAPLLATFGDETVIYIDQTNKATIISKTGDILSQVDLNTAKQIETAAYWETSIPAHDSDTLYAHAEFIDDTIYYSYWVENGKTYGMRPYLGILVRLVELPCQSGWIQEVGNKKHLACHGKVRASLPIWKEVLSKYSLGTIIRE